MGKRYYRNYNRKSRNYNQNSISPLEMLVEMLVALVAWLIQLTFKLIYKLFVLARDRFYGIKIEKRVYSNTQTSAPFVPHVYPVVQTQEQSISQPHIIKEEKVVEKEDEKYLPYKKKDYLLSKAEYNFDKILTEAVQDKYYIGRQVPLSSIVEVTSTYKPYRSKIDKKTIDFVLFNKAGYTPHLAIELDDRSHLRWDRIQRDEFVKDVLGKAGIRLSRVKNAYSYSLEELVQMVK